MLVRAKKVVVMGVIALATAVISLPVVSVAATSPTVTVLSPLTKGLRSPVKMVMDAAGNAYIADQRIGGVVKLDAYGSQVSVIKTAAAPAGMALAQDGTLLVSQASFVARYDVAGGQEVGRIAGAPMQSPTGIAVDNVTGYIYIADGATGQVLVYNASGAFVQVLASGLLSPSGVTFEKVSGQVVVADTFANKVRFFNKLDGTLVKSVGNPVSTVLGAAVGVMQFAAPVAVAFEYSQDQATLLRMYVVDAFQSNIQVVDPATSAALTVSGTTKNYIGSSGTANGQLMVPSDAVFDSVNSRLLVVNGFGNVTIYGIDGGKSPEYVDATPPVFTLNQVPAEVTVDSLTISGTVEAGATVQVSASGSSVVGAVVYAGSAWSVQVAGLTAGANSVTVTAKDVAGNSAAAQVVNVNYLLPAPALTISPVASVTKSPSVTLTGTVDAGAVVVVTNQATSVSGNAVVSGTAWSYNLLLAEGGNTINVSAQKTQSATVVTPFAVTLDTVAPVLSVSALQNGSYTSTSVQNISGTIADPGSVVVTVNGAPVALAGNAFSVPVSLVNGSNTITVVAVDAAGNTTADSRTLYFDAARPNIAVLEPVDNSFTSSSVVKVSGSVDKVSSVTVAGVAATLQDNSWSASVNLLTGSNTIEIVATDLYGNSSSVKRSITLDASNPNLSIVSPAQDMATNVPNVLFSGTVADSTTLSLEYTLNGSTFAVPVNAGTYSFNVDFAAEGTYPVTVKAKDAAGNTSAVVRNVIYDITPPVFTLNQVNGAMPSKLSGTVEAGSSVVIKDGATQVGTVNIANGLWTADLAGVSYSPESLMSVATDAAGNSTSASLSYSYPSGTLNPDGIPTVKGDALRAIRIVVNQLTPTAQELASYDIGPLVNGKPNPNGKIEIVDAILILRKALGLKSW